MSACCLWPFRQKSRKVFPGILKWLGFPFWLASWGQDQINSSGLFGQVPNVIGMWRKTRWQVTTGVHPEPATSESKTPRCWLSSKWIIILRKVSEGANSLKGWKFAGIWGDEGLERLQLVLSKAIMVITLLKVRSIPSTKFSSPTRGPGTWWQCRHHLGHLLCSSLVWLLCDCGRAWWHLGFGMTGRTKWETLQVQTERKTVLCQHFLSELLHISKKFNPHAPDSRSVNSSKLLGRHRFSVSS